MAVALLKTDKVLAILHEAVSNGCYIEHDKSAGTAKAHHSGALVFEALQKGKDGPWICRFLSAETVVWAEATAG
jgi:hypothetical protein